VSGKRCISEVNHHEKRILEWSVIPGPVPPEVSREAMRIAEELARSMGVEGLVATEFFLLKDGRLLVNELAPRPHNSFHATEMACVTSQFEQFVRAHHGSHSHVESLSPRVPNDAAFNQAGQLVQEMALLLQLNAALSSGKT